MSLTNKRKSKFEHEPIPKKPRLSANDCLVRRGLLEQSYARVNTLRDHVLSELPSSSKVRRKKIASLGQHNDCSGDEYHLSQLLDKALICTNGKAGTSDKVRWEQWQSFSQQNDDSHVTLGGANSTSKASQHDVCDTPLHN
jgi:telomerase reverse transcriptase